MVVAQRYLIAVCFTAYYYVLLDYRSSACLGGGTKKEAMWLQISEFAVGPGF